MAPTVPGTPRVAVGSFPETPGPIRRRPQGARPAAASGRPSEPHPLMKSESASDLSSSSRNTPKPLPPRNTAAGAARARALAPAIPTDIIDAPTQRLYAIALFGALQIWKFYDCSQLYSSDNVDSISELWFVMKWVMLDSIYLWALPSLRIPWLTFSTVTTITQMTVFLILNIALSRGSGFSLGLFTTGFWKIVYDRELSIAEQKVKWSEIVNNASHIQGKYTVKILPEGSAKLNPEGKCYCLGPNTPVVHIPIRINGSVPLNFQVGRIDFKTSELFVTDVKDRETKRLLKGARRDDDPDLIDIQYPVKEPGLYRLERVKDVSGLEVKKYKSEALVVTCPKAKIVTAPASAKHRCTGQLSDFSLSVEGLAPLKVKYGRNILHPAQRGKPTVFSVQSVQPENFESPFLGNTQKAVKLLDNGSAVKDVSWGATQIVSIPLNESLATSGEWVYSVDEVEDACGNMVSYTKSVEEGDRVVKQGLVHSFNVHSRPRISFESCGPHNPLDLARGKTGSLPIRFGSSLSDPPYTISYSYVDSSDSALADAPPDGETKDVSIKSLADTVTIKSPGIYSLKSVSSKYCAGEIIEPSTCMVLTPPEPSLSITHDEILDKCTASSIGLTIDLTLVGTPPFILHYRVIKDGTVKSKTPMRVDRTRHQLRFTPEEAGHYVYEFYALDDKTYDGIQLDYKTLRAEQTVKPLAGASFLDVAPKRPCIDESVEYRVKMIGTAPWKLNWDLIYNGKKTRFTENNIVDPVYTIKTPQLTKGGKYSLALATVEDVNGCKIFLESEVQIDVRFARPSVRFAPVEGKMTLLALEGKSVKLPLRMTGEGPWTVKLRSHGAPESKRDQTLTFRDENSKLTVNSAGTYELLDVKDAVCPGSVEEKAKTFDVQWIPRPTLKIQTSPALKLENNVYVREDVCEGDEDSIELNFTGTAPFQFAYEKTFKPEPAQKGKPKEPQSFENSGDITAALGLSTIRMDTKKAGLHTYKFTKISDSLYDDPRGTSLQAPVVLQQTVNSRPSTTFGEINKIYKSCLDSRAGEEVIPIHLHGKPPFSLTVAIKHFSNGKTDHVNIPFVDTNVLNFQIPQHALTLGQHAVSVLKVKDARGCVRKTGQDAPHVIVAVADMPKLTALDGAQRDYCVGDRIAFNLQGVPPFSVEYEFNGQLTKASTQSNFVRVAQAPGNFTITGLMDSASECKVHLGETKIIHEVPSVKIHGGDTIVEGIHEGDQAEIRFQFYGTPPFTFTYTRSEAPKKGSKERVVEQHSHTTYEMEYRLFASLPGTYEVTMIEDKYCSYPANRHRR